MKTVWSFLSCWLFWAFLLTLVSVATWGFADLGYTAGLGLVMASLHKLRDRWIRIRDAAPSAAGMPGTDQS